MWPSGKNIVDVKHDQYSHGLKLHASFYFVVGKDTLQHFPLLDDVNRQL